MEVPPAVAWDSFTSADGADDATLDYDDLHRLTSAVGLWGSYGYTYDPLHNLRSRTGPGALTYSYNGFNQLSGISGSQTRTYGYNAKGYITGDGTKTFAVNPDGQITSITGVASYAYDGNGRRIRVTPQSGTIEYALYSLGGDLLYTEKGTEKTDFLKLAGQTLVELKKVGSATTATWLHPDLLGSPRKATSSSAAILWTEHYDPWGRKINGVAGKIGYTGHAHDAESDYTYMQARFYDASVGRFLSTDPVHFQDDDPFTFNRYAYANNNPYRYKDPSGESPIDVAFLVVDGVKLGVAIASGNPVAIQSAAVDFGLSVVGVASPIPGTGQALKALKGVEKAAEIYRGSKLARNMANEGRGVIKGEEQAHHIVAENAQAAAPAREILEKHGIGINDAANGAAMKTKAHQSTHTAEYYETVNREIQHADQAGGKGAVVQKLCDICNGLEDR